jgi:hypothetical protein
VCRELDYRRTIPVSGVEKLKLLGDCGYQPVELAHLLGHFVIFALPMAVCD